MGDEAERDDEVNGLGDDETGEDDEAGEQDEAGGDEGDGENDGDGDGEGNVREGNALESFWADGARACGRRSEAAEESAGAQRTEGTPLTGRSRRLSRGLQPFGCRAPCSRMRPRDCKWWPGWPGFRQTARRWTRGQRSSRPLTTPPKRLGRNVHSPPFWKAKKQTPVLKLYLRAAWEPEVGME